MIPEAAVPAGDPGKSRAGRRDLLRGFYAIIDPYPDPRLTYHEIARALVDAGCGIIQLRAKGRPRQGVRSLALDMRKLIPPDRLYIVNDDPDIAVECGADGVHVGQDDADPAEARRVVGPDRIVGLSTHTLDQVRAAARMDVDYIGFGPVFPTRSKLHPDPVTGVDTLGLAVTASRVPIVAIGGITLDNLESVMRMRPAMVCSIAGPIGPGDLIERARVWVDRFRFPG